MIEKIYLDDTQEVYFDSKEVISKYKMLIESSAFLQKGIYKGIYLDGLFSENLWVYSSYITKYSVYINFEKLEKFKTYGLTNEYKDLIKCWVADILIKRAYEDNESNINLSTRAKTNYEHLFDFIEVSKNFSLDFIDDTKGSEFQSYFLNLETEAMIKEYSKDILSFISFIEPKFIQDKQVVAIDYIDKLTDIFENINIQKQSRQLPKSKDILLFNNYIDLFFNSNTISSELKMYFYPINLWWKITNVIPLRASEFCLKIKRDCLVKIDDGYYLKINRVKSQKNIVNNTLPLLIELKITKEIYEMIKEYIDKTNDYGLTKTLISYPAMVYYRDKIKKNTIISSFKHTQHIKQITEYFTNTTFTLLLHSFYDVVIKGIFKDERIKERICPNDTRHFAFTSLILQGIAPEKIAILGGHRNLSTLDNYTCSANTYIDSEVMTIIQKNLSSDSINRSEIKKIIFMKDKNYPKHYNECFETEIDGIKFGYCTANFNDTIPCISDECYYCDKWWCLPTEENYITLFNIITKKLKIEENKLDRDIKFIKKLFKQAKVIDVNGDFFIDKDIEKQFKQTFLSINRNTNKLISLKSQLIEAIDNDNTINLLEAINDCVNKNGISCFYREDC